MAKIHEFDPQIYPRKLWITVGEPYEELKDVFRNLEPMDESDEAVVSHTGRSNPDKGGVLIRFLDKKAMTTATIAHEATHAAMMIFDYVCAIADPKNQEPFCYLVGWVAKCIEEVKRGKV